jgi:hypothetical protein
MVIAGWGGMRNRGLSLPTPESKLDAGRDGEVGRVAKLGELINEYHRIAARIGINVPFALV